MKKNTIKDAMCLAARHDGECLSSEYVSAVTKMSWRCSCGHVWWAHYNNIKQGKWCPRCSRNIRVTIEDAQLLAAFLRGKCLSSYVINARTKLSWQCSEGHTWDAAYYSIKDGTWCPTCGGRQKKTIDDCKKLAEMSGGECLSVAYSGAHEELVWKCGHGHAWSACYSSIQQGSWCPSCSGNIKHKLQDCCDEATLRGGKCMSSVYKNAFSLLLWTCGLGHMWYANFDNTKNKGKWCPQCSSGKSQRLLADILKYIFPNYRHHYNYRGFDWLTSNSRTQELDIFIEHAETNFSLAVEYDGAQHFKPIRFGGSEKEAVKRFKHTQFLDDLKNSHIASHPKDVQYFVRFNYLDELNFESVILKLRNSKIPM